MKTFFKINRERLGIWLILFGKTFCFYLIIIMPWEYSNISNCFNQIGVHFSQNSLEIPTKDFDLSFWLPASGIPISLPQSYEIKSPPWAILWFRILGIFSVENIKRLGVFMFQTWDSYCESVQSWLLSQVWNIKTHNIFIFSTE